MDDSRRRRRRSTLNECSSEDVSSKRGCLDMDVFADHDQVGLGPIWLPRGEDRQDLDRGSHHEGVTAHPQKCQLPFCPSRLDRESVSSPNCHHRRLPVIPRPRFPAAILPPPSLAAMLASSANTTAAFHNITPPTPPPFCFAPSVDNSTAVPPSSSTLPPPPPPPFAFCHPAFWGAVPFLIGRALFGDEQVREDPLSGFQTRCPVENDPGLCRSSWRSWEPHAVSRSFRHPSSPSHDASLRPLQEAASSGLEDMAKMVSRLDEVKKLII